MRKQPKELSYDDKMELDLLENLEFRTCHLCNEIRLNGDIHISWADLCSILSPSDPSKIADKIFAHINKMKMFNSDLYHEIYDAIYDIGNVEKDGDKFYNCDVLWISSISHIIYENFREQWKIIIKIMHEIHREYGGSFDLGFLFRETILTMREKCLIGDDLFTCEYEYKKCKGDGEDNKDEIDKVYEDYYGEEEYDCGFEDLEFVSDKRILH